MGACFEVKTCKRYVRQVRRSQSFKRGKKATFDKCSDITLTIQNSTKKEFPIEVCQRVFALKPTVQVFGFFFSFGALFGMKKTQERNQKGMKRCARTSSTRCNVWIWDIWHGLDVRGEKPFFAPFSFVALSSLIHS